MKVIITIDVPDTILPRGNITPEAAMGFIQDCLSGQDEIYSSEKVHMECNGAFRDFEIDEDGQLVECK